MPQLAQSSLLTREAYAQLVAPMRSVTVASTADSEELHRSGTTLQAGTPRWPHPGGETTQSLHIPRDAVPARLSSSCFLAMASPHLEARRKLLL